MASGKEGDGKSKRTKEGTHRREGELESKKRMS